jgi:hypothetical protein
MDDHVWVALIGVCGTRSGASGRGCVADQAGVAQAQTLLKPEQLCTSKAWFWGVGQ